ncbi:MAG: phosphotransferase [Actinomycetota bacterium]
MAVQEQVPASFDEVDDVLLAELLGEALGGGRLRGFTAERIGEGVGMMGSLHRVRLDVEGGDGSAPSSVIVKLAGDDAFGRQNAAMFGWFQREVHFYSAIADGSVRTPACHAARHDAGTDDFVLVLEDLGHLRTVDQIAGCSIEDARTVMRALARFGAAFWEDTERVDGVPHAWDSPNPEGFAFVMGECGPQFEQRFPGRLPPELSAAIAEMPAAVMDLFTPPPELPHTLMHNDFRLDNLLFDDEHDEVAILDWQLLTKGAAGGDVAYFLSQSMSVEDRRTHERELVGLYHSTLAELGAEVDPDVLWDAYRRGVLVVSSIPISAGVGLDPTNERGATLLDVMLDRSVAAIVDLDAVKMMP